MPEIVKADAAQPCPAEESAEATGEIGGVEGAAGRGGEDESVVRPARSCVLAFFLLAFPVALEGMDTLGGEGDAAFGSAGLGVQGGQAPGAGALERAVDAGRAAVEVEVEVFPAQAVGNSGPDLDPAAQPVGSTGSTG